MEPLQESVYSQFRKDLRKLKENVGSLDKDFGERKEYVKRRVSAIFRALEGLEKIPQIQSMPEIGELIRMEDRFWGINPFEGIGRAKIAYKNARPNIQLVIEKSDYVSSFGRPSVDISRKADISLILKDYIKEREANKKEDEIQGSTSTAWYTHRVKNQLKLKEILNRFKVADSYLSYEDSFAEAIRLFEPVDIYDSSLDRGMNEMVQTYNLNLSIGFMDDLMKHAQKEYGISDTEIGIPQLAKKPPTVKRKDVRISKAREQPQPETHPQEPLPRSEHTNEMFNVQTLFRDIPKERKPSDYYARFGPNDLDEIRGICSEIAFKLLESIQPPTKPLMEVEIRDTGMEYEALYESLSDALNHSEYSKNPKNQKILIEASEILRNLPRYRSDPSILFDPMRVNLYHIWSASKRYEERYKRKVELNRLRSEAGGEPPSR